MERCRRALLVLRLHILHLRKPFVASNWAALTLKREHDRWPTMEKVRGTKHISYQELMDRKNKGLCFHCGERFHHLHQCFEKSLKLVIIRNEDEEGPAEVLALEVEQDTEGE